MKELTLELFTEIAQSNREIANSDLSKSLNTCVSEILPCEFHTNTTSAPALHLSTVHTLKLQNRGSMGAVGSGTLLGES